VITLIDRGGVEGFGGMVTSNTSRESAD